ncbi:AIPR family protein [Streptomyces virginiae]|uniref:AIPR family protein n=1 Tax=Streptomyces virginiae TaxID=1961 RepID=UPI003453DB6D
MDHLDAAQQHGIVQAVRAKLMNDFGHLISIADVTTTVVSDREQISLSRALAALAVRRITGWSNEVAAACVVDGEGDRGIDAIALVDQHLYLVQAKWQNKGTAGFGQRDALQLVDGLRKLWNGRYPRFNARIQALEPLLRPVLSRPHPQVTFVLALMGDGMLHPNTYLEISDAQEDLQPLVINCRVLHRSALRSEAERPSQGADYTVRLPFDTVIPVNSAGGAPAYMGLLKAHSIANLYDGFGDRLVHPSLCPLLAAPSEVARHRAVELMARGSLVYSNGITLVGDSVDVAGNTMDVQRAQIVNGAQTTTALHSLGPRALRDLAAAHVPVRVISLQPAA